MKDQQKRLKDLRQRKEASYLLRSPANARDMTSLIAQMKQAQRGPVSDSDLAAMRNTGRD